MGSWVGAWVTQVVKVRLEKLALALDGGLWLGWSTGALGLLGFVQAGGDFFLVALVVEDDAAGGLADHVALALPGGVEAVALVQGLWKRGPGPVGRGARRERAHPRALPQSPIGRPRALARRNPWPGTASILGHMPPIHPGGMTACSRWLSEATPPEPGLDLAIDPGRGRSPVCDISPGRPWRLPCVSFAFFVAIQPPALIPGCR